MLHAQSCDVGTLGCLHEHLILALLFAEIMLSATFGTFVTEHAEIKAAFSGALLPKLIFPSQGVAVWTGDGWGVAKVDHSPSPIEVASAHNLVPTWHPHMASPHGICS